MRLIIKPKNIPAAAAGCIACLFVAGIVLVGVGQPVMNINPSATLNIILGFAIAAIFCIICSVSCAILNAEPDKLSRASHTPSIKLRLTPTPTPSPTPTPKGSKNKKSQKANTDTPAKTTEELSLTAPAVLAPAVPAVVVAMIQVTPLVPTTIIIDPVPRRPSAEYQPLDSQLLHVKSNRDRLN